MFSRGSLKLIYVATLHLKFEKDEEKVLVEVLDLDSIDMEDGQVNIQDAKSTGLSANLATKKKEIMALVNRWFEFLRKNY